MKRILPLVAASLLAASPVTFAGSYATPPEADTWALSLEGGWFLQNHPSLKMGRLYAGTDDFTALPLAGDHVQNNPKYTFSGGFSASWFYSPNKDLTFDGFWRDNSHTKHESRSVTDPIVGLLVFGSASSTSSYTDNIYGITLGQMFENNTMHFHIKGGIEIAKIQRSHKLTLKARATVLIPDPVFVEGIDARLSGKQSITGVGVRVGADAAIDVVENLTFVTDAYIALLAGTSTTSVKLDVDNSGGFDPAISRINMRDKTRQTVEHLHVKAGFAYPISGIVGMMGMGDMNGAIEVGYRFDTFLNAFNRSAAGSTNTDSTFDGVYLKVSARG